ncbi:MAG: peroxiredoxin [Patescibacteria group bacterium]
MATHDLKIGDKAPAFTLLDEAGNTIRLQDLLGKQAIVLFFYPGDFTPGCTVQLCAVRDDWETFTAQGLAVFGINHADAKSHQAFRDKHGFPFPLLIDEGKAVSRNYGATRTLFKTTVIKRTVVGINTRGLIHFYKHGMPRNQEIIKAMKTKTSV